ncbi:uncharacterized protein LOC103575104 [Microplitis demolitor]|uniref:uncharacterized protein LOC103575104 n=1 Tax=Microplitis demolitor TaxID=69319 RepID=UPI00235B6131|nr:uncharacterized protein LOC103575104 [Microplitis demolitor]
MLAVAIRGVVLLIVIGWYSNSVWKMIDGYFKDKFEKYLRDEYKRFPQMKKDVQEKLTEKQINEIVDSTIIDSKNKPKEKPLILNSNVDEINKIKSVNLGNEENFKSKDELRLKPIKEINKKKKSKFKNLHSIDKIRAENDENDFSEFESDGDKREIKLKGIRVASLSFKPKADIGSLDIISEDEFCPINLDNYDEETCGEIKVWP